jgi:cell division protein ZipA
MDATTLRWIIAIAGVFILGAIFLFGNPEKKRKPRASRRSPVSAAQRREPTLAGTPETAQAEGGEELMGQGELPIGTEQAPPAAVPEAPRRPAGPQPEKIVTLFLLARDNHVISGAELLQAALKTGMEFGDMNIFHRRADGEEQAIFSMANALKPGYFDKDAWNTFETAGLALFLTLPGPMLALDAWDMLLATARRMAEILHAEIQDSEHQPLTRQGEAQLREEMRSYDRGRARKSLV